MAITEWELTADVASWINEIISKDRSLPLSKAKCEQRAETSLNPPYVLEPLKTGIPLPGQ